jgi:HAD superfamily hydrolase (TIGR01509 family)
VDAVIFDCDGVLVDSEVIALRVEIAFLAEIGLIYERDEFAERFLGHTMAEFYAQLGEDHRRRLGCPLPEDFPTHLGARLKAEMEAGVGAVAGVHAVVAAIAQPKAVASSSGVAPLTTKLRKVGLFDLFAPHIYSGEVVARSKPWPDLYLHAAAQLGVEPQRCVAVEDSINGVRAAAAAGMHTIGFLGGGHCPASHGARLRAAGAHDVVDHMDALRPLLDLRRL